MDGSRVGVINARFEYNFCFDLYHIVQCWTDIFVQLEEHGTYDD